MTPEFPRPVRAPGPPPPKQVAAERLRVYRRRVWTIRRRVIATALVAFALLWAVLFVQLATGSDQALSKQKSSSSTSSGATTTSAATGSSGTTTTSSGGTTSGSGTTSSSGSTTSGSGTTSTSGATTPVTTSQS